MLELNMYKAYNEIFDQNRSLRQSFDEVMDRREDVLSFFSGIDYEQIVFVGCGSSYWLSLSASATFEKRLGVQTFAVTAGEVVMHPQLYQKKFRKSVIIVPSRSGSTSETLRAVSCMKDWYDCRILAIVAFENSPLAGVADMTITLPWICELSICQTRSFSNLYMTCSMLAAFLQKDKKFISELDDYISSFGQVKERVEDQIKQIYSREDLRGLVALGSGSLFGVMCEGAYITMEMAQTPAHYFYTMELRHGPIVLLNEDYLVVICTNGRSGELEEKLIADIHLKKAKILMISSGEFIGGADYELALPSLVHDEILGMYASFIMQAIAYYKAIEAEVNPDQPPDLVPWIQL